MKHPILYHKAKGGDLRQWEVWTVGDEIFTRHGQVGGKLQVSEPTVATPKNVGKKNETLPEEQADLEAKALWKYKVDRKYSETPEEAQEQLPLPMLAHSYKGTKKTKFKWPAHVQPKLDGARCLAQRAADGSISLTSRQGKPWNIPLVAAQLGEWLPEGTTLDGELYTHGESCQKIMSWAKSADPAGKSYKPESKRLIYHIYDMPVVNGDDTLQWRQRFHALYNDQERMIAMLKNPNVGLVFCQNVADEDELWDKHGQYIEEGYEGAILRGLEGSYLWGYRSADLLKVKEFQDAEFEVVGAKQGKGKMLGKVIFVCKNNLTNDTFECTMKVPMSERERMFKERDKYIGQTLTVRFFDRTDEQKPRFPVGIVFRAAIDLPTK